MTDSVAIRRSDNHVLFYYIYSKCHIMVKSYSKCLAIFWKYRDISFHNMSYRRNFLIPKYRISILIVFMLHMNYIAWI